jgi:hypothetical protein
VYYQRDQKDFGDGSPAGKFSYCEEQEAWVFTVENVEKAQPDKCNWLLRSPKTKAYVLNDVPSSGWSIWNGAVVPTEFSFSCGERVSDVDCNSHGTCTSEKRCKCNSLRFGSKCQSCGSCSVLNGTISNGTSLVIESQANEVALHRRDAIEAYQCPVY